MGLGGPWLDLSSSTPSSPGARVARDSALLCSDTAGLTPGQTKLCLEHPEHMEGVGHGAKTALAECQHQFREMRWNCSTTGRPGDAAVFGPMYNIASRESAFVHAIAAAGVAVQVSRACRDGRLASCGCSRAPRPRDLQKEWVWGGCGDNLEYGA
ncbi:protein Wnt-5a-like, partial [Ctenocephalides felis]